MGAFAYQQHTLAAYDHMTTREHYVRVVIIANAAGCVNCEAYDLLHLQVRWSVRRWTTWVLLPEAGCLVQVPADSSRQFFVPAFALVAPNLPAL